MDFARREWLETNGLGGYASSTACGMNTRRYHGLLVAATRPPVGRMVLLSKLEETLVVGGKRYELSANQYPGVIHPNGAQYLIDFRCDPFPVLIYEVEGVRVEKSIFMPHGENTSVIRYQVSGAASLELRPLIAFRDYHSTTHENRALDPTVQREQGRLRLAPYRDLPPLYLAHDAEEVHDAGVWYRNFEYERERERGLDFREDLFNPCVLASSRAQLTVIVSTEPREISAAEGLRERELARRAGFQGTLAKAADQFLVKRGDGITVIAGYHWFSDWGRDTMIALPGLTLSTGRPEMARAILHQFAGSVDRGMLPNRFPDSGEPPEYNTVDATLWFFEAVRAYLEHTGDLDFVRAEILGVLAEIVAWHEGGTRHGIHVEDDGLLAAGEQLTWMDARVEGRAVTPRAGKAVEIQALWYNALRVMEALAERLGQSAESAHYRDAAARAAANFPKLFWNPAAHCLYDVVTSAGPDPSIRPNQIFAVSLPYGMLDADHNAQVVDTVERRLLTPFGLRTLDRADPRYQGRFEGGPASRDRAYHQGSVWPWLMGPFLQARRKLHGPTPGTLAELARYLENEGAGQLPEVFDGDPPHRAGGCIAQAWSVAEFLRVVGQLSSCRPASAGSGGLKPLPLGL